MVQVKALLSTSIVIVFLTSLVRCVTSSPLPCHVPPGDDVGEALGDADKGGAMAVLSGSRGHTEVDHSVCLRLVNGSGVNVRSTCPWHYQQVELSGDYRPRAVLQARLTRGTRCLKVHGDGGKRNSSMPCRPVLRSVSVLRCGSPGAGGAGGCHTERLAVPVAFTCVFPAAV